MKILSIVGTRPNFMKIAPLVSEFKKRKIHHVLVHTGQHYDKEMSQLFFEQLGMPKPDFNLGIGSGTFAEQVGTIIIKLEQILKQEKPDVVVVVGDVNSTFAGAFVAKHLGIPVAHVEAGLRSFDMSMPEEINRILTDRISDYLFTTEASANQNLLKEGISKEKIHFVGNVMIDTLMAHRKESSHSSILKRFNLRPKAYVVLTLHRPSNVDDKESLSKMISIAQDTQKFTPLVFPIHPRTQKNMEKFGMNGTIKKMSKLIITNPLGYLDFLCLLDNAKIVLTDSGGIQEETTILGVPCITLRDNTERPITHQKGTNMLISTNKKKIIIAIMKTCNNTTKGKTSPKIPLWDGKAGRRVVSTLFKHRKTEQS